MFHKSFKWEYLFGVVNKVVRHLELTVTKSNRSRNMTKVSGEANTQWGVGILSTIIMSINLARRSPLIPCVRVCCWLTHGSHARFRNPAACRWCMLEKVKLYELLLDSHGNVSYCISFPICLSATLFIHIFLSTKYSHSLFCQVSVNRVVWTVFHRRNRGGLKQNTRPLAHVSFTKL